MHWTNYYIWKDLLIFRRESGNCRVCWSADAATDVGVSGDTNIAKGVILVSFSSIINIFLCTVSVGLPRV